MLKFVVVWTTGDRSNCDVFVCKQLVPTKLMNEILLKGLHLLISVIFWSQDKEDFKIYPLRT